MLLRRSVLIISAIGLSIGLFVAGTNAIPASPYLLALTGGLCWCTALLLNRWWSPPGIAEHFVMFCWLCGCIALGTLRMQIALAQDTILHMPAYHNGSALTLRAEVSAEPEPRQTKLALPLTITAIRDEHGWQPVHGSLTATWLQHPWDPEVTYGDRLELQGKLLTGTSGQPLGGATLALTRLRLIGHHDALPGLSALFHLRETLAQGIATALPPPEAALAIGILLGWKTPVLRERLPLFTKTGTIHLVVTSGLKVTLVAGMVTALTRWLPRWARLVVPMGAILGYVLLSGSGPAAWRAGIMGMVVVLASWLGREYDLFNALALAAIVQLLWSPGILWDVAFQLSIAGTLGIAVLAPRLKPGLERALHRIPAGRTIADVLTATIAAQIGTLPIIALAFGIVSIVGLLTNVLLVPFLPLFISLAGMIGGLALFDTHIAQVGAAFSYPVWRGADLLIASSAGWPFASITVGSIPLWITPCWLMCVGTLPLWWPVSMGGHGTNPPPQARLPLRAIGLAASAGIITGVVVFPLLAPLPSWQIMFLPLSKGGTAILIRSGQATALIDGGADGAALLDTLGSVLPYWQRRIDVVLATNTQDIQMNGLMALPGAYTVGLASDAGMQYPGRAYTAWHLSLATHAIPYQRLHPHTIIDIGEVHLELLEGGVDGVGTPDQSALVRVTFPGGSGLLAGNGTKLDLYAPSPTEHLSFLFVLAPGGNAPREGSSIALRAQQWHIPLTIVGMTTLTPPRPLPSALPLMDATATALLAETGSMQLDDQSIPASFTR